VIRGSAEAEQEASMDMMWGMSGMMVFMVLGWLVVIAAVVAGVLWLVRNVRPGSRNGALDILRERYARGEISREEYESRRRDLAA
jgi:putative membrane protein